MSATNNTTTVDFESWYIVTNISSIVFLIVAVLLAIIFLVIVALNKTCQTMPIILTSNSCLAEIVNGCNFLGAAIFTSENGRKHIAFQDALCVFRGYLGYVGTALLLYSFVLSAIYRYMTVVYPARTSWQSTRVQFLLICLFWIFPITSQLPWVFTGDITYDVDSQVCLLPFRLSLPIIYDIVFVYSIPVSIIVFVYLKLVRYVRQIGQRATSAQTIFQARRELVMMRRIIILISIMLILGIPYLGFVFMAFISHPPKYHFRICIVFVDLSQALIMIVIFKFTQPVMDVVLKLKRVYSNDVQPGST